jgi:hypothetical protein
VAEGPQEDHSYIFRNMIQTSAKPKIIHYNKLSSSYHPVMTPVPLIPTSDQHDFLFKKIVPMIPYGYQLGIIEKIELFKYVIAHLCGQFTFSQSLLAYYAW